MSVERHETLKQKSMHSHKYSRVPLMWTPKGQAKSVHINEPSTVVDTCTLKTRLSSDCSHMAKHDY